MWTVYLNPVFANSIPQFSSVLYCSADHCFSSYRLTEQNKRLPTMFVSSKLDVSTAVALMRGGAIHVLEKPPSSIELLNAIQEGVSKDQNERRKEARKCRVGESIAMLTAKERQLLGLIANGRSIKAIASELNICARAAELRRRGIMDKLGLKSSFELLRYAMLAWQECNDINDIFEAAKSNTGDDYNL